jgi:hypothetical protein
VTYGKLASVTLAAVLVSAMVPSHARSAKVEFTPVIAHITPLKSQVADIDAPLVIRQSDATAYGARVGIWLAPRIGVEGSVLVGSSSIQLIGGTLLNLDATTMQLDLRARIRLNDPASDNGFDAIVGVGMNDLNDGLSDAGESIGLESPSTVEFVIGLGATISVSDHIRLRFDAEDHIHDSNYEIDETAFGSPVETNSQNDLVFALGVVIPLW